MVGDGPASGSCHQRASGVVTGTPTTTGVFTPTITLTDAVGFTDTLNLPPLTIAKTPAITGPADLPDWTRGQDYPLQTMTWQDGTAPFTWAASGLPTGLDIDPVTGEITGTPTASLTFTASVTVTDSAGASATKIYTVKINPPPGIATAALPPAEVARPYNTTVAPTGGTPPLTWSLPPPKPPWLSINSTPPGGVLFGTPPVAGEPNVTVRVTDAANVSAQKTYSLTIAEAVRISGPAALTEPNWTINRDYPGIQITGANGVGSYAWSATGLPPGMSINSNSGVITGTPTATGTFTIVVTVVDDLGGSDTQNYTLTIHPSPTITTASLPSGEEGVAYSATLDANLGTTPYTWAGSGLPDGLSVNAATGVLSGTPTLSGTFSVTITVTDHAGASVSRTLTLDLNPGPSVGGTLPDWTVDVPVSEPADHRLERSRRPTPTARPGCRAGLSIGAGSGIVSGTPTAPGVASVVVTIVRLGQGNLEPDLLVHDQPGTEHHDAGSIARRRRRVGLSECAVEPNRRHRAVQLVGHRAPDRNVDRRRHRRHLRHADGRRIVLGRRHAHRLGRRRDSDVFVDDHLATDDHDDRASARVRRRSTSSSSRPEERLHTRGRCRAGRHGRRWGADGVLSGDPPAVAATYTFTVSLTDAGAGSTSTTFTLTIT